MKKKLFIAIFIVICMSLLVVAASASAPLPPKPDIGVEFGSVTTIDNFTPPSQLFVNTDERVLLVDGNGNYVTYPTYYITKDSTTFDVDFKALNSATGGNYSKASVAMLEIPEGITTISNRVFSGTGYAVCKYIQFPGTITSFGDEVFNTNKACKIVEFVDGTEPFSIGNGIFSGAWNGGPVIEYVKFPNNLVSIGNNAFGKVVNSKTIILGENLESIGTGFFGEATPYDTDTFIYASNKFFGEANMFNNLFGGHDKYHNSFLRITLFYVGTKEEAQGFVNKGLEVQSGYIFDKATVISANEYVYETHKPADKCITVVYDYGKCDAFHGGVHSTVQLNACVENCTVCGLTTIKHADANAEKTTISYKNGFLSTGIKHTVCSNEDCNYDVTEEAQAIFETNGYSIPEDGRGQIAICFAVNKEALNDYESIMSEKLTYGAFAIAYKNIGDGEILDNAKAIKTEINRDFKSFEMKITGIKTEEQMNAKISFGAYVISKEGKISYLQAGTPNEGEGYYYTSYQAVLNQTL